MLFRSKGRKKSQIYSIHGSLDGASGKEPACQCKGYEKCKLSAWVGKIFWRRKWQPTPVFLPGESYRQRNRVGYNPWGRKESDMTEVTEDAHRVCIYQLSSAAQLGTSLCNPMDCSTLGFAVHHQLPSLLKLIPMESVIPPYHLIFCHALLLPSIILSIMVFSNESVLCIR